MCTFPITELAANFVPPGDHAMLEVSPVYPSSDCRYLPLAVSQRRTGSSAEPEASHLPSGDHVTQLTAASCPCKVRTHTPSRTSHTRIVLSPEGDARYEPSGDQAIRPIQFVCPRRTWRRVRPGAGEPPISVRVVGRSPPCSSEGLGSGSGCSGFCLLMCVSPRGGFGARVRTLLSKPSRPARTPRRRGLSRQSEAADLSP